VRPNSSAQPSVGRGQEPDADQEEPDADEEREKELLVGNAEGDVGGADDELEEELANAARRSVVRARDQVSRRGRARVPRSPGHQLAKPLHRCSKLRVVER